MCSIGLNHGWLIAHKFVKEGWMIDSKAKCVKKVLTALKRRAKECVDIIESKKDRTIDSKDKHDLKKNLIFHCQKYMLK